MVLSRHGVGKTGFLIGLAVDQLLQGKKVLYISTKESVEHINNFFDQIFHAMAESLDLDQLPQRQLRMERNRYIHQASKFKQSVDEIKADDRIEAVLNRVRHRALTEGVSPNLVTEIYRKMIDEMVEAEIAEFRNINTF